MVLLAEVKNSRTENPPQEICWLNLWGFANLAPSIKIFFVIYSEVRKKTKKEKPNVAQLHTRITSPAFPPTFTVLARLAEDSTEVGMAIVWT
jgi:hypothetical protein